MTTNLSLKLDEAFAQTPNRDRDYVSPGFKNANMAHAFPHRVTGDKQNHPWVFLRREVDHAWYVDDRNPMMGFLSVDEASVLHTLALALPECEALEIGCHRGWSTAHLAAAVKQLDVIDPVLADPAHFADVEQSLTSAGVRDKCALYGATSPAKVHELIKERGRPWSFIFVDGDHEPDGPLWDAQTVANCAARDAIIVFHDLASPVVAEGLAYLRAVGWSCLVFQTMQIMGVAWRGKVKIPVHIPDPKVNWSVPDHLRTFMISGETPAAYAQRIQKFFVDYSSHDPYARAKAPLPIGLPTQNALPTDIRKLQEDLRASEAEAAASKAGLAVEELMSVLLAERARAAELDERLRAETLRASELRQRLEAETLRSEALSQHLDAEAARLGHERHSAAAHFESQLAAERAEIARLTEVIAQLSEQMAGERAEITRLSEAGAQLGKQAADSEARYRELASVLGEKNQLLDRANLELVNYAQLNRKLEALMKSRRFLTRRLAARMLNR
jgi:predicted O-methyltransferase YrrM